MDPARVGQEETNQEARVNEQKRIPDTSDMPAAQNLAGLMGRLGGGYIEAQEAQGQRDLVASTQLPVDGTRGQEDVWAAIGVQLLPEQEGDIFRGAVLPAGWEKRATDHSMLSELVDAQGRKRAAIFYKAAFYDRSAHVRLECRFGAREDYDAPDGIARWLVTDACNPGTPAWQVEFTVPSEKQDFPAYGKAFCALEREHGSRGGARAWLDEHYPDHQDPAAYWGEGKTAVLEDGPCP